MQSRNNPSNQAESHGFQMCLSQACVITTPFVESLQALAASGCQHLEAWLTTIETALRSESSEKLLEEISSRDFKISAAAFQGGLLLEQGEKRTLIWDQFKRRLDLCQRFSIPTLIITPDNFPNVDLNDLATVIASLAEAGQWAAGFHVNIALEFQAASSFCNNLETALLLAEQTGEKNVGICLDAFHFFNGPSKSADLKLLNAENLMHVQLCDVAGVPREFAKDSDRIFPGEGDFDIASIVQHLKTINYCKAVSLEVLNPTLWKVKPSQVFELGFTALSQVMK